MRSGSSPWADLPPRTSGTSWASTGHTLIRLAFDVLDLEPDLVMVMHNINDLDVTYRAARRGVPVDGHYRAKYGDPSFTGEVGESDVVLSRLVHSIRSRVVDWRTRTPIEPLREYTMAEGERIFERNLRNIVTLTRRSGSEIKLITMPYAPTLVEQDGSMLEPGQVTMFETVPPSLVARDMDRFNQVIRRVAVSKGAPLADMHRALGADEEYFVDVVHYSSEGVHRFGHLIAPKVARYLSEAGYSRQAPEGPPGGCRWH